MAPPTYRYWVYIDIFIKLLVKKAFFHKILRYVNQDIHMIIIPQYEMRYFVGFSANILLCVRILHANKYLS